MTYYEHMGRPGLYLEISSMICPYCRTDTDSVPHETTMTRDGETVHVVCKVQPRGYIEAISGEILIRVLDPDHDRQP